MYMKSMGCWIHLLKLKGRHTVPKKAKQEFWIISCSNVLMGQLLTLESGDVLNKYMRQEVLESNSLVLHGLFPFSAHGPKQSFQLLSLPDLLTLGTQLTNSISASFIQIIKKENLIGSIH
jgi:hypothetical protein